MLRMNDRYMLLLVVLLNVFISLTIVKLKQKNDELETFKNNYAYIAETNLSFIEKLDNKIKNLESAVETVKADRNKNTSIRVEKLDEKIKSLESSIETVKSDNERQRISIDKLESKIRFFERKPSYKDNLLSESPNDRKEVNQ